MKKYLSIDGFGDVHEEHFECGLVLAENYFSEYGLDFLECYESYKKDENSVLGQHWREAEQEANLALYAFGLQGSSMLELKIVDKKSY